MNNPSKINYYDLPKKINFNLTWRCNINCLMCNNSKLQRSSVKELNSEEVIGTVKAFKHRFDISMVRFWGGEPFIREDLFKIIENISPSVETTVITNGTLITPEKARNIINSGLDVIEFSIDLPNHHHDFLRGKGVFERAKRGLHILKNEKDRISTDKPRIIVRPLITKNNHKDFKQHYQWVIANGFDFHFVFLRDWHEAITNTYFQNRRIGYYQPGSSGSEKNDIISEIVLNPNQCNKIWEESYLFHRKTKLLPISKKMRAILRYLDTKMKSYIYTDCSRSRNNVSIDPYGNLYPCELLNFVYGNCITDGPSSWFSEKRLTIRKEIIEGSLPICRECNRYGHKRPLLSSYIYLLKFTDFLLHGSGSLPNPRSIRVRLGKKYKTSSFAPELRHKAG